MVRYDLVGHGRCHAGERYTISFKTTGLDAETCQEACTKDSECIGYTFLLDRLQCLKHYAYYHLTNSDQSFVFLGSEGYEHSLEILAVEPDDVNTTVCYRKQSHPPLACLPCSAGSAQNQTQQSSCASCMPVGYQNGSGQEACKLCNSSSQQGFYTHSVQAGDCYCKPGFAGSTGGDCQTCLAPNYTQKTAHDYTLLGNGICTPEAGQRINGRIMHGIDRVTCEAECESWSSCSAYEFITSLIAIFQIQSHRTYILYELDIRCA